MPVSVLEILRPVFLGFKFTNLENSVRAMKNEISLDNTLPKSADFFPKGIRWRFFRGRGWGYSKSKNTVLFICGRTIMQNTLKKIRLRRAFSHFFASNIEKAMEIKNSTNHARADTEHKS